MYFSIQATYTFFHTVCAIMIMNGYPIFSSVVFLLCITGANFSSVIFTYLCYNSKKTLDLFSFVSLVAQIIGYVLILTWLQSYSLFLLVPGLFLIGFGFPLARISVFNLYNNYGKELPKVFDINLTEN